jgi:hypothetical protein
MVRVVQSAIARFETAALIRKMMIERGMKVPPADRTSTRSASCRSARARAGRGRW